MYIQYELDESQCHLELRSISVVACLLRLNLSKFIVNYFERNRRKKYTCTGNSILCPIQEYVQTVCRKEYLVDDYHSQNSKFKFVTILKEAFTNLPITGALGISRVH